MSYQPKPTVNGVYRIKVLTQNLCIECDSGYNPRPGIKLTPPSTSNNKQLWSLTQVSGQTDVWTITNVDDQTGLSHYKSADTYWGYGYPLPTNGSSEQWKIVQQSIGGQTFSRIHLNGSSDCFDSCDPGSDWIHFYYEHRSVSDEPRQCYVFELVPPSPPPPPPPIRALDIMFLQDFTGSQQPYINTARNVISSICTDLLNTGNFSKSDLRFAVVAFRDHPPQDQTFVTKTLVDFTPDIGSVVSALSSLQATGGRDGPEAQVDALADAVDSPSWNSAATKVAILLTDAPPHGLKEDGDFWGYPQKCPCQRSGLRLAGQMRRFGIGLTARQYYEGLVQQAGGTKDNVVNLGNPGSLAKVILGVALQEADSNALITQHAAAIRSAAQNRSFNATSFAQELHTNLSTAHVHHHTLCVESMVEPSSENDRIVQIWAEAEDEADAIAKIENLNAAPCRLKHQYQSGGSPDVVLEKQPISLAQVECIVHKCLARQS